MSTTGLTEKLTLALNSKNAIKSTLVDRAAIEEAAPFTAYAGAIENIGAELPDIASWVEYELPVTMVDARKYTYDAEHIFIFDTRTDTQGLWRLNSKTQQIIQILDNGCGYSKYYKLDDTHLLIAGSSYENNIILYNLEDDTYELLVSKIAMKSFTEISTGFLAISNNTKYNSYFINKNTFEVTDLGTDITNWEVGYTDDTHTLLYYSSGGKNPYAIDNKTCEVTQLTGMITTTYKWKAIKIDDNTVLFSHGSSTKPSTDYLGIWEWKKAEKIATKIYNDGWYLETCANMNNKAILRCSEAKQNLLIYDKATSTIEVLLENVGYSRGCNNLSRIPEGALITHTLNNNNAIYVYNEENAELIQLEQAYSYDFKHYVTDYGVFLGTGNTTAGYYYNNETRTIGGAGCYFTSGYTVLETSFGQIIYNCRNGIYINRYVDGVRSYKVLGDNRQTANHTYSTYAETEDYFYFCGGGSSNYSYVVKQHKTNYDDSEVFLNTRSTAYGTIITADKNVYIYGDNLYVYNEETGEVTTCPVNDFIDSEKKLVPAYDMVTTNNLKFTDTRGIIDPVTNTVSTIPFRKYLWKNYTFDNYGVTNINNGQQYQFKYPYGSLSNGWGFIDCNYTDSEKVTVFNNTNIFTAICKNAIIVCNKEV